MSFPALFSILFFGLMQSRGQAGKTARPALKSTSAFDLGNRYIPNCVQVQEKTIVLQGSSLSLLFSHTEPDSFLCCPSLLFCPNLLSCPFRLCCPYLLCCPSLLCCLSLLCCPSFLSVVLPSLLFSFLLYISFFCPSHLCCPSLLCCHSLLRHSFLTVCCLSLISFLLASFLLFLSSTNVSDPPFPPLLFFL